jgi:hypothetical protein
MAEHLSLLTAPFFAVVPSSLLMVLPCLATAVFLLLLLPRRAAAPSFQRWHGLLVVPHHAADGGAAAMAVYALELPAAALPGVPLRLEQRDADGTLATAAGRLVLEDQPARVKGLSLDLAPALHVPEALLGHALGDGHGQQGREEHREEDELTHISLASLFFFGVPNYLVGCDAQKTMEF